ncbi:cupin domain-containing protein [Pontibacter sp. CAU 1760]
MNPTVAAFLESGMIELYILGATTPEEAKHVEEMAAEYPEVQEEINQQELALENYAQRHAATPRKTIKPLLLATIDFMERMEGGEEPSEAPELTPSSKPSDFDYWLKQPGMQLPEDADDMYAKIISHTPKATTAIAWIKTESELEVHHDELERFLILEGTCDMIIGDVVNPLAAGDFFAVPLHVTHQFKVTSESRCKAILQRLAVA